MEVAAKAMEVAAKAMEAVEMVEAVENANVASDHAASDYAASDHAASDYAASVCAGCANVGSGNADSAHADSACGVHSWYSCCKEAWCGARLWVAAAATSAGRLRSVRRYPSRCRRVGPRLLQGIEPQV